MQLIASQRLLTFDGYAGFFIRQTRIWRTLPISASLPSNQPMSITSVLLNESFIPIRRILMHLTVLRLAHRLPEMGSVVVGSNSCESS
jgi:hypothetical protein